MRLSPPRSLPHAVYRRVLRSVYRSLMATGSFYTGVHPELMTEAGQERQLGGPGTTHPERVRRDVPLTQLERAILFDIGSV
jgi:hypothetical protein